MSPSLLSPSRRLSSLWIAVALTSAPFAAPGQEGAAPPRAAQEASSHAELESCGACHAGSVEAFRRGPHLAALRVTGEPSCTACHAGTCDPPHETMTSELACAECHTSEADAAARTGLVVSDLLRRADDAAAALEAAAARWGTDPSNEVGALLAHERETAGAARAALVAELHALDLAAAEAVLEPFERRVEAAILAGGRSMHPSSPISRRVAGVLVVALVALFLGGVLLAFRVVVRFVRRRLRGAPAQVVRRPVSLWRAPGLLFTTKLGLALTALLLVVGSLAGLGEAYAYWSSPGFCTTCHHMEEYYASWERSSHNEVTCVQCHFEPGLENEVWGKWVAVRQLATAATGAYDARPHAKVSRESCMRSGCHPPAQMAEVIDFTRHDIPFRHASHLGEIRGGLKLSCTSCHNQITISTHIEVEERSCFLCHFGGAVADTGAPLGDCRTCHVPPNGAREVGRFSLVHADLLERGMSCQDCHAEVHAGTGQVDVARCLSCHNRPAQVAMLDDPALVHASHVDGPEFHCYECHDLVEHEFAAVTPEERFDDCAACHTEEHAPQARLFAGEGAKGVAFEPSDMHTVSLDCRACHEERLAAHATGGDLLVAKRGHAELGPLASCDGCHSEGYSEVARSMSATLADLQGGVRRRLDALERELREAADQERHLSRGLYRGVSRTAFNLDLLAGGRGVHNPEYAFEILRDGDRSLAAAEDELGLEPAAPRPLGLEGESCMICHADATGAGLEVRHAPVAEGLCTTCHSSHTFGEPKRVVGEGWESCGECHADLGEAVAQGASMHPPVGRECGLCHDPHASEFPALLRVAPAQMCVECHDPGLHLEGVAYHAALTSREGCGNCHETHAASLPSLLKAPPEELCLGCHEEPRRHADGTTVAAIGPELRSALYVHEPVREGDCAACHDPHGSQGTHLLSDPNAGRAYLARSAGSDRLCYDCHDASAFTEDRADAPTSFRNGEQNLHAVHLRGDEIRARNCALCHEPHTSSQPHLLTDQVASGAQVQAMRFVQHERGGSCASLCHVPRTYDREEAFVNPPSGVADPSQRVPWPSRDEERAGTDSR